MREAAERTVNVSWLARTAEDTGLANASADVVTAFQAFHWFAYELALDEMQRILRPIGRAATIYNDRDESDEFTAAYGAIARRYATNMNDAAARSSTDGRDAFAAFPRWTSVSEVRVRNHQVLDRAALKARATSTSYLPRGDRSASDLDAELDTLFDRYVIDDSVTMHMKTTVTVARI